MRNRLSLVLAAATLFCFSSAGLAAEEMVDNPAYKAWAKYKVGTTVTRTMSMNPTKVEGGELPPGALDAMKMEQKITETLKEITPEKVVVASTETPNKKMDIPAKIEKSKIEAYLVSDEGNAKVTNVKDGKETLEIAGKKHDTETKDFDTESTDKDGGKMTGHVKCWSTAEVPGAVVKMELVGKMSHGPMTIHMTVKGVVVEFKVEK